MPHRNLSPEISSIAWKCCGLGLFQLGLMAGLSLMGEVGTDDVDPLVWLTSALVIAGALLVGRTGSRTAALSLWLYMLGRLVWEVAEMGTAPAPLQYLKDGSDLLLTLLALKAVLLTWELQRRDSVRFGRIVTKMLGRFA